MRKRVPVKMSDGRCVVYSLVRLTAQEMSALTAPAMGMGRNHVDPRGLHAAHKNEFPFGLLQVPKLFCYEIESHRGDPGSLGSPEFP